MKIHSEADSAQVQQDIEHTRAQLDETLTAIEHRLAPRQLLEDGMDYLRHHGGREYLSNLSEAVKREPIPLALVGVGLAWMMMSQHRGTGNSHTVTEGADHDAAHGRASSSVRDKASAAAAKVSDLAQGARDRARQATDTVRDGMEKARGGYDYLVNEQPLALGAIGFALGVIMASAAPHTDAEDRLLGDSHARPKDEPDHRDREQADRPASVVAPAVGNGRADPPAGAPWSAHSVVDTAR